MYRYPLMLSVLLVVAAQADAQSKADALFDELSRDFGSVPYGQVVSHPFRIVNNTKQPVHVSSVSVSCGRCSSARALKNYLQPGEETAIIATMDANQFIGTKTITITVVFDQPRFEQVRLWIQANSRQDVSFTPNTLDFGRVKRGTEPEAKITVNFLGGALTKISDVKSESNYVSPSVKELERSGGSGSSFEISAKLRKDTPAGKWYTDLWLTTNNSTMQKLRVPVMVEVEAPLTANPSTVSLGQVKAGTETDRKVIIRGVRPFRITGITGTNKQVMVRATNDEAKTVHVLTVTLNPDAVGPLSQRIRVQTDLAKGTEGDIEFFAQATVEP
jgi:Protein of unknown function (DUF1573)